MSQPAETIVPGLVDPALQGDRVRNSAQLAWYLTRRDLLVRYRGSWLGVTWSLVTPAITLAIYALVFGVVLGGRFGDDVANPAEFSLVLFLGLILFWLVSDGIAGAPRVLLGHSTYVKKVVFPLHVLPCVAVGGAAFHTLVRLVVFVAAQWALLGAPPLTLLWMPLVLAPVLLLTLGLAWALAALGVFLRDLNEIMGVALTGLLFLSPVFYSIDRLPEALRAWVYLNPITIPVEQARRVAIGGRGTGARCDRLLQRCMPGDLRVGLRRLPPRAAWVCGCPLSRPS